MWIIHHPGVRNAVFRLKFFLKSVIEGSSRLTRNLKEYSIIRSGLHPALSPAAGGIEGFAGCSLFFMAGRVLSEAIPGFVNNSKNSLTLFDALMLAQGR
jgi:hypothetical protein